jgi:glycerophosphoryl diester phosphodiesterase
MASIPGRVPALSAHRGGGEVGPAGTYQAYLNAVAAGVDYVEFDVRRTGDGVLVALHEARAGPGRPLTSVSYSRLCELTGHEVPRIAEVMRLLAGRAAAHIDLKGAGCAAAVLRIGLDLLGPAGMIVTTGDRAVLASLKRQFPAVPAGLSIGGGLARSVRRCAAPLRRTALSRAELAAAGLAGWAAIHHRLAGAEVLAGCQRQGIKTMVWTVNADRDLVRWMATPGVDALVTDRPCRAVLLREHRLAALSAGKIPPERADPGHRGRADPSGDHRG